MSITQRGSGTINPEKMSGNNNIQQLKERLDGYAVELEVAPEGDLDAIFTACEKLEDEIPPKDSWLIYENFNVDVDGYPNSVVEIEFFTDVDVEETSLDDVHQVGY